MNIILNLALTAALIAGAASFATQTFENVITIRAKKVRAAAETRMLDEIGRKLAGGDATIIQPDGGCDSPYCPVLGKAGQN